MPGKNADLSDVESVAQEIDDEGSALVRHDIAQKMIASGEFEQWEGEGQATGFVPIRRSKSQKPAQPPA